MRPFDLCSLLLLLLPHMLFGQTDAEDLLKMGRQFYDANQLDSAKIAYAKAAKHAEVHSKWELQVEAVSGQALVMVDEFLYDSALSLLMERHQDFTIHINEADPIWTRYYDIRGRVLLSKGRFNEALSDFQKSMELYVAHPPDRQTLARAHDHLGDAYRSLDRLEEAVFHYDAILDLYPYDQPLGAHINVSKALADRAIISRQLGEFEEAIAQYEEGLQIVRLHDTTDTEIGAILNGLAIVYAQMAQYPEALTHFEELLELDLKQRSDDDPLLAKTYTNLGILHELMGDFRSSVDLHEKALAIKLKTFGLDHSSLLYDYKGLAQVFQNVGDIAQTLTYANKALALEKKYIGPQSRNVAVTNNLLASVHHQLGNHELALQYFDDALNIYALRKEEDFNEGPLHHNLSTFYSSLDSFDLALHHAQRALDINQSNFGEKHSAVAGNLANIGRLYQSQGEYEKANNYLLRSLAICKEVDGITHQNTVSAYSRVAEILHLQGAFDRSLAFADSAILQGFFNTKNNERETLIPKDMANAFALRGKAFLARYSEDKEGVNLRSSQKAFKKASDMIVKAQFSYKSKGSVAHLKEELAPIYEAGMEVCYAAFESEWRDGAIDQALLFAEQSKASLLVAALNESRARTFSGIPEDLLTKENALRRDLGYYEQVLSDLDINDSLYDKTNGELFRLRNNYEILLRELESTYPSYYSLKYDTVSPSLANVQTALLDDNTSMLQYFMGQNALYLLHINSDQAALIKCGSADSISAKAKLLIDEIRQPSDRVDQLSSAAHKLYQELILKSDLPLKESLIIIPDGILNYLPFEILINELPKSPQDFRLDYLFYDHIISYAFSATYLSKVREQKVTEDADNFLAFAPAFDGAQQSGSPRSGENVTISDRTALSNLIGTSQEIASLQEYFDGLFLKSNQATENAFKQNADKYQILHLATHAILDEVNPMNSKLLFSTDADGVEDADLHAWELFSMDLKAKMAVLSACNTAQGKIKKGEGVISLGRAFAYAGCPSIVMSLWPAQDESTANIMSSFYKYLAQGQGKDVALQLARKQFLEEAEDFNTHPFYWSGFITQGNQAPVKASRINWKMYGLGSLFLLIAFLFLVKYWSK